ncbi:MAG: NAD kinase [Betaproteobacteria bacterium]|nr:NAD kinase [Betaproteobacteria bacterium]
MAPAALSASVLFPRVGLVGRYNSPGIAEPLERLAQCLAGRGRAVTIEAETAALTPVAGYRAVPAERLGAEVDLVIVLGGDGTMLSIARLLAPFGVPLIGINQGRLGFLTDIVLTDLETMLAAMLEGEYEQEERRLLACEHRREGSAVERSLALNDVVVNRGVTGSMIECAIHIDGRFVSSLRADGLIVATPTGSTAYALSSQGPIVHPAVPAFALVPVAPHALTHRPIVVSDASELTITVLKGRDCGLHCDGQAHFRLQEGEEVRVTRAGERVQLLHPRGYDYYAMLREKLHWTETPEKLRAR